MKRHQRGSIYEKNGAFHVQYYTTVEGTRKRVSQFLTRKDDVHYSRSCQAVREKCEDFMRSINTEPVAERDATIVGFYDNVYLAWATEKDAEGKFVNLRASTVWGYKQLWSQHLKPHFGDRTLREYRTSDGSRFLDDLPKNLSKATVQHIRSLASGVFSYALNRGLIDVNPWSAVKTYQKRRGTGDTPVYRLEEVENIISALVEHVDAQLVVALAFFTGLRPGEIGALRWEDFSGGFVHVRRAIGRGVVAEPKTERSVASLPLIAPVTVPLELWRAKCGNPREGWLFTNARGKPLNLKSLTDRVIVPTLAAKKIKWKGLYAGRRGAATILRRLTGDSTAGKELLRHTRTTTTERHYEKPLPEALLRGIRLLEEATTKSGG
jgi:integrase